MSLNVGDESVSPGQDAKRSSEDVYRRSVVIDGRDPTFLTERQLPIAKQNYWETLAAGGVTAVLVDVPWVEDGFGDAVINFAAWHERIADSGGRGVLVRTSKDIRGAKRDGKIGVVLTSQTPTPIGGDLTLLRPLYELGLRAMQLSYQKRNLLADACGEPADHDGGLSNLGRKAIAEMNRLGIAIDLSHASDRTMEETIELSSAPVFFSHSNARSLVDHRRNVPDGILRRLAEKGGMCCVSAYSEFIVTKGSQSGTSVADMARMVAHLAKLIGIEHIGFGLDVGEFRSAAEVALIGGSGDIAKRYSFLSRASLPSFADALAKQGFSEMEIEGVLGLNLLHFLDRVWKD
jgi:membrane dipeptidase